MATAKKTLISALQSISLSSSSSSSRCFAARSLSLPHARPSCLLRLCPLLATIVNAPLHLSSSGSFQCFSTRPATSSLNDPSPNWSNRPPKETILLDGCDFEHWLVVMEPPEPTLARDEIIDGYIKTLAQVLGSEEEARMSIYSVSTKHYFAFGCKVSEELSYKIKPLPKVRWVLPDSYLDVKNKDYGGEPFIDGKAVPYDPKHHEEWVRNNARAQERSRRSDRPRNFDRSRNFERRRENMQNFQNRETPGPPDKEFQNLTPPNAQNARDVPPMPNCDANAIPPNVGGMPNYQNQLPNAQGSYVPNAGLNHQGSSQGYQGGPGYQGGGQGYQGGNSMGNMPAPGYQGGGPGYQGGGQGYQGGNPMGNMPAPGYQGGGRGHQGGAHGGYQGAHQGDSPNYQAGNPPYQGSLSGYQQGNSIYQGGGPNYQPGGVGYQGGAPGYHGRDIPGSGPNYQPGGVGYQGGAPGYHGRDIPGREQ